MATIMAREKLQKRVGRTNVPVYAYGIDAETYEEAYELAQRLFQEDYQEDIARQQEEIANRFSGLDGLEDLFT